MKHSLTHINKTYYLTITQSPQIKGNTVRGEERNRHEHQFQIEGFQFQGMTYNLHMIYSCQ